jgi:hypothetical protein
VIRPPPFFRIWRHCFINAERFGELQRAGDTDIGRTTQLWDATAMSADASETIVLFRCAQLALWPKSNCT